MKRWIGSRGDGVGRLVARFAMRSEYWVDFEAFEVIATDMDGGNPEFQRKGQDVSPVLTASVDEAEPVFRGHLKWDGCNEVEAGEWSTHQCGLGERERHHEAIMLVLRTAARLMGDHWDYEMPTDVMSLERFYEGVCDE